MCSPFRSALLVVVVALVGCASRAERAATQAPQRVFRVVADPNNLPFSNDKLEGFENRIAKLLAREMNATLEYAWRAQRRGFFRHAFNDDGGQLVIGVPAGFERSLTTEPYYRSSYVFVWRRDRNLDVRSFDDPRLRTLRVGVQLVGDEGADTPPAHALARRGIVDNVVGYTLYGDYTRANPPARIMDAVASGEIDVAVVWGPLAGFYAKHSDVPLKITSVSPQVDPPAMRFAFDIAVGVRKGDAALRDEVNAVLARNRVEVQRILSDYGVPLVPRDATAAHAARGEEADDDRS